MTTDIPLFIGLPIVIMIIRITETQFAKKHVKILLCLLTIFASISTFIFWIFQFEPLFLLMWFGYLTVVPLAWITSGIAGENMAKKIIGKIIDKSLPPVKEDEAQVFHKSEPQVFSVMKLLWGILLLFAGIFVIVYSVLPHAAFFMVEGGDVRIVIVARILYVLMGFYLCSYNYVMSYLWEKCKNKSFRRG